MANKLTVEVLITDDGTAKLVQKGIEGVGKAAETTTRRTREASKAQDEFNYKLNQGTIGASSAARSFSKLNQAIGEGPNGLVGAYATLAANAFAVSAAFLTLKEAAQAEQLLKGLEAQGARTGRTLTAVANSVKELSGASLSSAEAMRAVAQASTAGISTTDIERLTEVATASARALGRDIPDSLNRLILGVTKAEPELVDELGLTIKLTEAMEMYARETGKTATSLTRLERQQALVNAWAAQGEIKFGALSDSVSANPYDQLAASFKDLSTAALNFLNNSGLVALVSFFATNKLALTAAVLFFISTIKDQLLPTLTEASKAAKDSALDRISALKTEQDALTKVQGSLAKHTKANEEMLASLGEVKNLPKYYGQWVELERQGADATNEHARAMKSLEASRRRFESLAETALKAGDAKKFDYYADMMAQRDKDIANLETYAARKAGIELAMAQANSEARQLQIKTNIEEAAIQAQGSRADAIEALSNGKLGQSYAALIVSTKAYKQQLTQEIILKAELAGVTNAAAAAQTTLNRAMILGRTAMFGLATGLKAVGSALLTALPYLALVVMAIDLIKMAWDAIKPEAWKKQGEAFSKLQEIITSTNQKFEQYNKIQATQGEIAQKSEGLLLNRVNTLSEALDAYKQYTDAINKSKEAEARSAENMSSFVANVQKVGAVTAIGMAIWQHFSDETNKELGIPLKSLTHDIFEITPASSQSEKALASLFATMEKGLPATTKHFIEMNNSFKDLNKEQRASLIGEWAAALQPAMKAARDAVDELANSLGSLSNDWSDFIRSISTTTPYDKLVGSIGGTVKAINSFKTQITSGLFQPKDIDTFLTQVSEASSRLPASILGESGLEIKKTIQDTDDALVRLRATQVNFQKGTQEYLDIQKSIKSLEDDRVLLAKRLGAEVSNNLGTIQKTVQQSQLDSITLQSNLALAQARLGVIQRQGKISADDVNREIDAKNKVVALQVAQINANRQYLQMEVDKKQLELESAVRRAKEIQDLYEKVKLTGNLYEIQLKTTKAAIQAETQTAESAQRLADINRQLAIIGNAASNRENLKARAEQAQEEVAAAERAVKLAQAMLAANDAQAAAAAMGAVTNAERMYEVGKQNLANRQEEWSLQKTVNDAKLAEFKQSRRLLDIQNGGLSASTRQFEILKEEFRLRRLDEQKQYEFKRDALALEIARAAAEGRTGAVEILIRRRKLLEEENSLRVSNSNAEERLALYSEIDLNTTEKKLELLSKSLEVYRKEADLQSSLLEKEQELNKLRIKNSRSPAMAGMGEAADKAIEFRALKEQLELAKEQLALKKLGIKLEYDLLEAQRLLLVDQLKAKQKEAALLASTAAAGSPEKAAAEQMVSVLGTSIQALADRSYNALRDNAMRIADLDIKILEERAKQAYDEIIGSFLQEILGKNNPAFSLLGALEDTALIIKNLKEGKTISEASTKLSPGVQAQVTALGGNTDAILNLTKAMTSVTTAVTENKSESVLAGKEISKAVVDGVSQGLQQEMPGLVGDLVRLPAFKGAFKQTSGYGMRVHPVLKTKRPHSGLDFAYPEGTELRSQTSGIVGFVGSLGGYGKVVDVYVGEMENGIKVFRRFAHMMDTAVKAGEKVQVGTLLGRTGSTGLSTGPHLHVEDRIGRAGAGTAISPTLRPRIRAYDTGASTAEGSGSEDIVVTASRTKRELQEVAKAWSETIKMTRAEMAEAGESIQLNFVESLAAISPTINNITNQLKSLGPNGEAVAAIGEGMITISTSVATTIQTLGQSYDEYMQGAMQKIVEDGEITSKEIAGLQTQSEFSAARIASAFSAASAVIGSIASILQATSQARITNLDKEIAAEQKRDGKSAESLAKIDAMEKKKDSIARKAFNTNKKLMMAQAVMSTAAGIAGVLAHSVTYGPILTPILAAMIGAMGLAQIAIISGTQYESNYTPKSISTPTTLSIGKRGDSVNLAGGPSANAGGEIGYLRGAAGTGTNASNYRTIGSAYGGEMMRGYGNRGFVVGEKGPEVINPETPISVTPANDVNAGQPINANISIQALDASDVKRVLVDNRGNIIQMLREAANNSGQRFMEDVNVNVYTRPNIGKL